MNTETPNRRPASSDEPIPGYRLVELLGTGGSGEVWKVTAPGGVSKAMKLIFDDHPSRGAIELRALNRIKDVRHPFLLTIDRIEQRPGLLTIVTELADRNLEQHCQAYREKGLPGIPAGELLVMLRDVADVLDYIYQEYALQHLDIKAANLLVFGKRLKVGDFGLVKNIYERSSNLVEGMTPAYAAPEIFSGKPSGSSDQYSLAIVYQEMLTGVLPFHETNPGRLAAQHLHDVPNLRSLPAAQQSIIARALSKDPQQRFPSCMDFIDELAAAVQRDASRGASVGAESFQARDILPGAESRQKSDSAQVPGRKSHPRPAEAVVKASAGGTESVAQASSQRDEHIAPTIVIGIGGSAAHLLQQLRQRLDDRLGTAAEVPAFKLMLIDTDAETLNAVHRHGDLGDGMDTVPTPLLNAADYRTQGAKHRRWLSRRWLYNIPRNLSTDRLRPLGRLALLSHSTRVKSALRAVIKQIATAESSCLGGRRVAGPPRILFVASISGGTGSGMVLDLAYAARAELQLAGFHQASVEALLLHSTPQGPERDKAILNAVATLREWSHYGTPGKCYPGEPLLDVPPFHGNNRTFCRTELMHLGNELDQAAWLGALDNAAEYVFARMTTPRSHFHPDPSEEPACPPMSSGSTALDVVQVRQIGGYSGRFIQTLAKQLCFDLVQDWCSTPVNTSRGHSTAAYSDRLMQAVLQKSELSRIQQFVDGAAVRVQEIGVDLEQLLARARENLVQELATDERGYLRSMFQQALDAKRKNNVSELELAALVLSLQDRTIGLDIGERSQDTSRNTLFDLLHSRLASQAMQLSAKFTTWVHDLVDHPDAGVEAARRAAEAGRNYIHDLVGGIAKEIRERHKKHIESRILLTSQARVSESQKAGRWWPLGGSPNFQMLENRLVEHGVLCLDELVLACVQLQLQSIEAQASATIDKLIQFGHELKQFGTRFASEADEADAMDGDAAVNYERSLRQLLVSHRLRLGKELRRRMDQDVFKGPKKLQQFLSQRGSLEQDLRTLIQDNARQVVLQSLRQVLLILLQHGKSSGDALDLDAVLKAHLQEPLTLGRKDGDQVHMVVPSEASADQVERRMEAVGYHVHAVSAPCNNISVCRESTGNSAYDLANQIAMNQPALIQLADALRSRTDVAWELLSDSRTQEPAVVPESVLLANADFPGTLCLSVDDSGE